MKASMILWSTLLLLLQGDAQTIPDFGADFVPSQLGNMNGKYPFQTTPGGKPGLFPSEFKDYPGGVESFEVYSPAVTTLYSQVWTKPLAPADLPADVVKKYHGRGMAIVGYEIDQVRRTPDGDVSVPISASYNHHFVSSLIGAGASVRKVHPQGPDDPLAKKVAKQQAVAGGCGSRIAWGQPHYLIEGPELSAQGLPTYRHLPSANGGEFRKTYHGFAPGQALVVDSPTSLQVSPFQIDTWNRDEMDISGPLPPKFVPGPMPRASGKKGGVHSGLLECPITTRVTKVVDSATYVAVNRSACKEPIVTSYECFQAAAALLGAAVVRNETGTDVHQPRGCVAIAAGAGSVRVFFNELKSSGTACSTAARCVCPEHPTPFGEATGALLYNPTNQSADKGSGRGASFHHKCAQHSGAMVTSRSLLEQKNPTCDIRYYRGGQWACNHMWALLDADQEIPWADRPLVLHHKYRFWVQPYDKTYHKPLVLGAFVQSEMSIASPLEYDVPKCAPGVPGCTMVDGTWVYTLEGSVTGRHTIVAINNHCHAGTCLSVAVYACAKGTPLPDCNTTSGKLVCETRPIYGGTGHPAIAGTRFDEPGYIANPLCLWGSSEYGLAAPVDLDGVPVHLVKTANATEGHTGEMVTSQPWVLAADDKMPILV